MWELKDGLVCCPKLGNELPFTSICGHSAAGDRIVGGGEADLNVFPWMAMLLYQNHATSEINTYCAGSLITNRYVLTAAHCVHNMPSDLSLHSVRLGEHNISSDPDCHVKRKFCAPPHVEVDVEYVVVHVDFLRGGRKMNQNDIALLRLQMPVRYSRAIKPICLWGSHDFKTNSTFQVAGWGRTETDRFSQVLMKGLIKKREFGRCSERTSDLNSGFQMCAGGLDGSDTCVGDSGSPLMATMGQSYEEYIYIAGITSIGNTNCGMTGVPAVYIKISAFIDWITFNLRP
ncbi:melanization protease 1 [Drosophila rhopaloa]|uniref:Peptidase S1 domain-containing protein n=1 Tax=Drosophila rhopaloa TaxID=1041015 RepID=A0ABM5HBP3_DRORH|nr:melanization protease 1 [Drosophila rhopaloa]